MSLFFLIEFLFSQRQIDIYHLIPNTTYAFRVWATNALGPGEKVEVLGATLYFDGEAGQ